MEDQLIKITIKGASGWGPSDMAYSDKLTIKSDGISYEKKPVIESEENPHVKWSYKTNSDKYQSIFHALGEQSHAFEKLPDEFVTDICPNQVKFYFENETISFETYFYHGIEQFVEMVKLMIPATEETPYCLPDEEPDDED